MEHLDHPSPEFNDAKMAGFFRSFPPSSLLWGGERGLIVPFILSKIVTGKQSAGQNHALENTKITCKIMIHGIRFRLCLYEFPGYLGGGGGSKTRPICAIYSICR